jgi:hypothetical protein
MSDKSGPVDHGLMMRIGHAIDALAHQLIELGDRLTPEQEDALLAGALGGAPLVELMNSLSLVVEVQNETGFMNVFLNEGVN